MGITASQLRQDVYRILDHVLETGEPAEITRRGRTLRIIAAERPSRASRLVKRPEAVTGDPEDLVHLDWSSDWMP